MKHGARNVQVLMAGLAMSLAGLVSGAEPEVGRGELPRLQPLEPNQAMASFRIRPGFHIELAAAEPRVVDPVAMAFDENGRLYVVEMRDYSERREEKLGRVRLLEDTDGDGTFERSTVFAEGLPWPTAVACWAGGVFVGVTPHIVYLKDLNGDGVADQQRVVFEGFARDVTRLNVQALLNSFAWGLDNRIHGVTSFNGGRVAALGAPVKSGAPVEVDLRGRDFSFDPRSFELRSESGGGQHGMSFDEAGRKFVCSNSRHLIQILFEDRYAARNVRVTMPAAAVDIARDGPAAEVFRVSPDEPWRIVRTRWRVGGLVSGPVEGGGRVSGYFTAATGVTIYRGDAWPEAFRGDAFIGDAGSNLIHRKKLRPMGLLLEGARPEGEGPVEFLTSTDNWFRPVQFANGPDGCLYVADMYREVIEHPWSIPESIKRLLDLNSGNDRGRIYRIVAEGFHRRGRVWLGKASATELVRTLAHPNGWHRDTASRLLYERQDTNAVAPLRELWREHRDPWTRIRVLHALEGLTALDVADVGRGLGDENPWVRVHAIRAVEGLNSRSRSAASVLREKLIALTSDPEIVVRYQLAFTLGEVLEWNLADALVSLGRRDANDVWMQAAILSSLPEREHGNGEGAAMKILGALLEDTTVSGQSPARSFVSKLAELVGAGARDPDWIRVGKWLQHAGDPVDWQKAGAVMAGLSAGVPRSGRAAAGTELGRGMDTMFRQAVSRAEHRGAEEADRLEAIKLLGNGSWAMMKGPLARCLERGESPAVQSAAVEAMEGTQEAGAVVMLLKAWPELKTPARSRVVNWCLRRTESTGRLLDAIEGGTVRVTDLDAAQKAALRQHRDAGIARRAAGLMGATESPEKRMEKARGSLVLNGDARRGREIFRERCATCHRLGNEGYAVGPDLATVRTAGKEKLLLSVLEPNREVSPNYIQYEVQTRDGDTVAGIIAGETSTSLILRQAGGVEKVQLRSQVTGMRSLEVSAMPEGLEEGLGDQGLADLLELLAAGDGG